jgi:hypothetical protein
MTVLTKGQIALNVFIKKAAQKIVHDSGAIEIVDERFKVFLFTDAVLLLRKRLYTFSEGRRERRALREGQAYRRWIDLHE